ncbi:Uncharacterized protein Adt_23259 [Abeliophyllum distichum]|uniref:Transposase (putative) gypsy type domain-containing protein n=1 Tax=Abeliophyllum distichum TaxID=126358 RepID=A0ABD1SDS1_9LAMI
MRGSLDKRDAPTVRALDEELRRSATEVSMARSRITTEELEDLRLSHDIPSSVLLRASGPEELADDPPEGFVAIYEPAIQQGHRLPMHPFFHEVLKDWNLAPCQITPNGWGQMVASYLLCVVAEAEGNLTSKEFESIYRPCRSFDCRKPPIPKRNQGELRSKWDKVRDLSSEFRSLNNLLKDDNLLASCGLMGSKEVPVIRLARPASRGGFFSTSFSARGVRSIARGPRTPCHQVPFLLHVPRSTLTFPRIRPRPPTFTLTPPLRGTKGRRLSREPKRRLLRRGSPLQPRRGLCVMPARRGGQKKVVSPRHLWTGEPEGARNTASSAGQNYRIRISERHEELPASVMEMLPVHPSIVVASVHRYWTLRWEKVAEEATVLERLQLAEVNLVRGLVLAKDIFSAFASFDAEDSKSKKLTEDLKVMGLKKVQLESDKRVIQFKLDLVVSKEADIKAKYEIELKAAKECLKQARNQRKAAEASQKRAEEAQKLAEEAQKLAEDRTLAAETALAAANSSLQAAATDNEMSLSVTKLELEKIKAKRADAEARAVETYQDAFVDTPEYQDLAQLLMTVGREQLVERIMEAYPEWDLSFLREALAEAHMSEADPGDVRGGDEGPSCADP